MGINLEATSIVIDDIDFEGFIDKETEKAYQAERIGLAGKLNFGYIEKGKESRINMEENKIFTPIATTALFAFTPNGTSDEVYLNLYREINGNLVRIARQRISSGQMPYDIPQGILEPEFTIGVQPTRSDAFIVLYVKPMVISFEAVPNPPA